MKDDNFLTCLHTDFLPLVELINSHGFKVGVIGGVPRDFKLGLLANKLYHDYDCELRPVNEEGELLLKYKNLKNEIGKTYKTRELAFGILRIFHEGFEAEISLPRLEVFNDDFHHSNFEATFIADRNYTEGFKRRDFTINAMMFEIYQQEVSFIDPLGGKSDLLNRILRPCSEVNFAKDPVRFLRALRFKLLLSKEEAPFTLTSFILDGFSHVAFENFTSHYLKMEMFKSKAPLLFLLTVQAFTSQKNQDIKSEVVATFDLLWKKNEKVNFFLNALFINEKAYSQICNVFKLKENKSLPKMPWKLRIVDIDKEWIIQVEYLLQSEEELTTFFYDSNLIDLSYEQLRELTSIKIDLSHVPNPEKKTFKYSEQARMYFEH